MDCHSSKNLVLEFSKHKYVNFSTNRLVKRQGLLNVFYAENAKELNEVLHSYFHAETFTHLSNS